MLNVSRTRDAPNGDNVGELESIQENWMPADLGGASSANDGLPSPDSRKRSRTVASGGGAVDESGQRGGHDGEEGGQAAKRSIREPSNLVDGMAGGDDGDALDMLIDAEDDVHLPSAPLISFPRAVLEESNAGEHWDSAPTSFPITSDTIDIEDMLQLPAIDRDGVWGDIDTGLGRDTQYVQLHESKEQPVGQNDPPTAAVAEMYGGTAGTHFIGNLLRSGLPSACGAGRTAVTTAIIQNQGLDETPDAMGPAPPQAAGPSWAPYPLADGRDPSTLETKTRILAPPSVQANPAGAGRSNSAIRIAPRGKREPPPNVKATSPRKPTSRPKRARQPPARAPARTPSAFASVPGSAPAPLPAGGPPGDPAAAMAASLAAAMALGRSHGAPPGAVPHAMAGPLLFAQGLSSLPPGVPPSPTGAPTTGRPGPLAGPHSGGMVPVDPLYLAHYYYAALTGAGGGPVPGNAFPDPARAAFLGQTGLVGGAHGPGPVRVSPRASLPVPPGAHPQPHPAVGPSTPGSTRPVFIADGVSHKVVEQQAPAKLMKHPVLGRLQLQSDRSAAAGGGCGAGALSVSGDGDSASLLRDAHAFQKEMPFQGGAAPAHKVRRKRLVWTPELHDRFVQAINAIGISQAVPKTLVQIMNVEGLSTEHVKSHLQKYRNSLKKAAVEDAEEKEGKTPARGASRMYVKTSPGGQAGGADIGIGPGRAFGSGKGRRKLSDESALDGAKRDRSKMDDGFDSSMHSGREEPRSECARGASPRTGGGPESETQLQMQERTQQLQFELQVMVHRTVALQKELQLVIEKQSEAKLARGAVSHEPASQRDQTEVKHERGGSVDIDALVKERMQMQRELERKTVLVKEEIGEIQKRMGEKKELERKENAKSCLG